MSGGMGRGARELGIDGEVVLESSLAKIVPKRRRLERQLGSV
jgi:hypothetical protein